MKARRLAYVAGASLLLAAGWHFSRVPYHRWRLVACIRTAERLRAGEYKVKDDFFYLLRGEPKTTADYERAVVRHEDALIRLKYFSRTNFALATPLRTDRTQSNFFWRAVQRFPNTQEWSASLMTSGDVLTVTTRPHLVKEWEEFVREIDHSNGTKVRRCKGVRRRVIGWTRA